MKGKRTLALVLLVGCLIFFLQQVWAMSMDQARADGELFATGKRDEIDTTMPTEETQLSSEDIPQYSQQAVDEGKEGELYKSPGSITDEALIELSTDENGQYLVNSANTRPKWEIYRDDPILTGTTEIMQDQGGACAYEFVCDEGTEEGECHRIYSVDSTSSCQVLRTYTRQDFSIISCDEAVVEVIYHDEPYPTSLYVAGSSPDNLQICGSASTPSGGETKTSCVNIALSDLAQETDWIHLFDIRVGSICSKGINFDYRITAPVSYSSTSDPSIFPPGYDASECYKWGDPNCYGIFVLEGRFRDCDDWDDVYYDTVTVQFRPEGCVFTGEDESQCKPYIDDDACTIASRECNEDTCKDLDCGRLCGCFSYLDTYACYRITEDTCGKGPEEGVCTQTAYECIEQNDDRCTKYRVSYHCDASCNKGHWEVASCDTDVYCAGEFCFPQQEPPADSEGFAGAATYTEVIKKTALEDPKTPKIFEGKKYKCKKILGGVVLNCCNFSGILEGWLLGCSEDEHELAEKHKAGKCHYVGTWCCAKALFVCLAKCKRYCCFHSKLARIIHEQGRGQLGDDFAQGCHLIPDEENPGYFISSKECWGSPKHPICQGFEPEELERLNFEQIDFSEYYSDIVYDEMDQEETTSTAKEKFEDYYQQHGGD